MKTILSVFTMFCLFSCTTTYYREETAEKLDLKRFMGKWYVISHIPTMFETGAYNAVETYKLKEDGSIDVDFRYHKDAFDGELKTMPQVGWIFDEKTKAHWKIRPFWPLKFDYLVHYIADDYSATIIGVPNRNYLWYMARTPTLSDRERAKMDEIAEALGYDLSKIREVPQSW